MENKNWTKRTPNFAIDLSVGRIGELAFIHACQGSVEPLDGREGDCKVKGSNVKLEIKTDSYDMNKTPNLFIEKYRSAQRAGGPWQALEHGCKYYVYCFSKNAQIFVFETKKLVERMELLHDSKNLTLTSVGNGSYTTRGLKIHRDWVTDLMLSPDQIGLNFSAEKYAWYTNYNKASA